MFLIYFLFYYRLLMFMLYDLSVCCAINSPTTSVSLGLVNKMNSQTSECLFGVSEPDLVGRVQIVLGIILWGNALDS